jgi:hypothetical protein
MLTQNPPHPGSRGYALPEYLAARRSAKRREVGVQGIALVIATACILAAGLFIGPVNTIRQERQLVIDPRSVKDLPPDIALLGKLGTFRALAIDWASIRAERLKEEGKMYEAMQLHETVCALAPRFPRVWANAAWNMAYNISVTQYTPEARWKWVQNGLKIIRDKGIQYNPRSVTLYKELAWIYWHKIGDFLDDEHLNYKRALAVEMETVLGQPPVTLNDQEYFDWFKEIVHAPRDLRSLIETDAQIAALVSQLRSVSLAPDDSLLRFVAENIRTELRREDLAKDKPSQDALTGRRLELLKNPAYAGGFDRLLAAVRSDILRERYKFDLDWMLDLMVNQYGPLDWRNAYAHALYWSSWGDRVSEGVASADPADAMNTARFVFFSLQQLITRGRITLYPNFDEPFESYIDLSSDIRYIPYLFDTYMRLGEKHFGDDPRFKEGTPGPSYMNGFVTAMHNWIELLYLDGGEENRDQAENLLAWLREHNKHPNGTTQEQYLVSIDEFVMSDLLSQLQTFKAASAVIGGFIRQALKQFSLGHTQAGLSAMARAVQCYNFWTLDTAKDLNERRRLQPPRVLLRDHIEVFMQDGRIDPLAKARLWYGLPLEQRQMAYDRLVGVFERVCEMQSPPWAVERTFPEPPGMEEFRKTEIETAGAPRQEGIDQGERYKP